AYPVKRIVGDLFTVSADLVSDGHDALGGALLYRSPSAPDWREVRLRDAGNDRWEADVPLDELGTWRYTVEGWIDHAASWLHILEVKAAAGEQSAADLPVELLVGSELCAAAAARARGADAAALKKAARGLANEKLPVPDRVAMALEPSLGALLRRYPDRTRATRYPRELEVVVERVRARTSAWYEMFPRSCGAPGV